MEQVPYATAKFAVRGFSEALRMDLLDTGVRVSLAIPGAVATNIVSNSPFYTAKEKAALEDGMAKVKSVTPETVAAKIVKAVHSGCGRVLIGSETSIMDKLVRLLPGSYPRLLHKPIKKLLGVSRV